MIVDFHAHVWRYAEGVTPPESHGISPEALLADMDEAGVDRTVMVPLAYTSSWPQPVFLDNDYLVAAVRKYPDRLSGLVEVDARHPDAVETVKRYLGEGLSGLKLMAGRHGFFMSNHNLLDPLFSVCSEARVPVFVLAPDDISSTPLQLEEMARTFPEVPAVIVGQMGRKWLMPEACMVANRTENVYLETSDANLEAIEVAVGGAGAHKVLFASHWPPNEMIMQLARHRQTIKEPQELEMVLGGNAQRILDARI